MNPDRERTRGLIAGNQPAEPPDLERPNDLWDNYRSWHGPKGTNCDAWAREVRKIIQAIEAREDQRLKSDAKYRTPAMVRWRLDCLEDLMLVLEHNRQRL